MEHDSKVLLMSQFSLASILIANTFKCILFIIVLIFLVPTTDSARFDTSKILLEVPNKIEYYITSKVTYVIN